MNINKLHLIMVLFVLGAVGCGPAKWTATPTSSLQKTAVSYPVTDSLLSRLLHHYPQFFDTLLPDTSRRIQIVYTQINRTANNKPRFTHYYYQLNPSLYFYPASTVKMPVAFLALQKLNKLKIKGLNKAATMITEKAYNGQTAVYNDPTSPYGPPSIGHYIKKIFLVSDNDAYNRLYEFLGQAYINNTLHQMGYDSAQIVHRLDVALSEEQNRHTNPVKFYDTAAQLLYQQPLVKSALAYQQRQTLMGKGFYKNDSLVTAPFDFSAKNRFLLHDLHSVLISALFPKSVTKKQRFRLKKDDYRFLYHHMSLAPRQSLYPQYDSTYNDAFVKFLFYGGTDPVEPGIRIFNKVGDAYGFLTDVAYIIDTKNGVEFLLSATIHCNSDGIYNDDQYEYETVGLPFLKNLGRVIYQYELNRTKKHRPRFSRFLTN